MTPDVPASAARTRVLVGAYACGPLDEPEAAAGWAFATAAAESHDVTVFTRTRFGPAVTAALDADPDLAAHLEVRFLDLPRPLMRLRQALPGGLYWYYPLWQGRLRAEARRLHDERPFDVAHHVTFANDWMRCGLAGLEGVPLVWGPVGGASRVPIGRLHRWLGLRGTLTEFARDVLTSIPRRIWGDPVARRSALVVAQNPDVARRFRRARAVVVEPNAALRPETFPRRTVHRGAPPTAVFAGRLLAWKGARLAITAIAEPQAAEWRLDVIGTGYDRPALERLARRKGVADRVRFLGHLPRERVLEAFADADALLFPSMHDQAGWVAAEASSIGCPVVCLPLGGPATLADRNAFVAALEGDVPANLARQLLAARGAETAPHLRWSAARLPGLVSAWYRQALATSDPEGPEERHPIETSEPVD